MRITVKFTGRLKSQAGMADTRVDLPGGANVEQLIEALGEPVPALASLGAHGLLIMLNNQVVTRETALHDGDEVMLLQILGGG